MASLRFDQVNIVLPDVAGAAGFLRALGADVQEVSGQWVEWAAHHVGLPVTSAVFDAELDSSAFAAHWGGLPEDFVGVVVNLRARDREAVDLSFAHAIALGAEGLRVPYDAFWGARYAVVRGPGPLTVGIMSPADPALRTEGPSISDFV